jgi:lipoyl(octanoyl) transferase
MSDRLPLRVRQLGYIDYARTYAAMRAFTGQRNADSVDELWLLQHPPVFTQGLNGKPEHLLAPGDIAVIPVDRGGQVTYHGPGQLIVYCLLDLKRAGLGIRQLVSALEQSVIALLAAYGIAADSRTDAPGVYVGGRKIASLGLRVKRGCSYHGLSLNVDMDLEPFARINPCGYSGLQMTQLRDFGVDRDIHQVSAALIVQLATHLHYTIDATATCCSLPDIPYFSSLSLQQETDYVSTQSG